MGIPGLWDALSAAKEVQSLSVAAVQGKYLGLTLAIDVSIWSYQCAITPGGENPGLRTLYYRLCRLLNLGVKAIFVFDGLHRPAFKRGKKTPNTVRTLSTFKTLIELFGFQVWEAPGEAEAECAHLQALGIVDGVLTDDVDALMFGASCVYKSWAAVDDTGKKSSTALSHTLRYSSKAISEKCHLRPAGMILIAMLAGGDYIPAGVPKCGIKTAVEIAAAGFGERLLNKLEEVSDWKHELQESLYSNADGHFSRKHPGLRLPESFPDLRILRYYTHPIVSSRSQLNSARQKLATARSIDLVALKTFVELSFEWTGRIGHAKFVRTIVQPLIIQELYRCASLRIQTDNEEPLVKSNEKDSRRLYPFTIHGSRKHISSGNLEELRISIVPIEVVPIPLPEEEPLPQGHSILEYSDDFETPTQLESQEAAQDGASSSDSDKSCTFDFHAPLRLWILRSYLEAAYPHTVKEWERIRAEKQAKLKSPKKVNKKLRNGTLDHFVTIVKAPSFQSTSFTNKETAKRFNKTNPNDSEIGHVARKGGGTCKNQDKTVPECDREPSRNHAPRTNFIEIVTEISDSEDEETNPIQPNSTNLASEIDLHYVSCEATTAEETPTLRRYFKSSKKLGTTTMTTDSDAIQKRKPHQVQSKKIVVRKSLPGAWREARIGEEYCENVQIIDLT